MQPVHGARNINCSSRRRPADNMFATVTTASFNLLLIYIYHKQLIPWRHCSQENFWSADRHYHMWKTNRVTIKEVTGEIHLQFSAAMGQVWLDGKVLELLYDEVQWLVEISSFQCAWHCWCSIHSAKTPTFLFSCMLRAGVQPTLDPDAEAFL